MSKETAEFFNTARLSGVSSAEAWDDLGDLAEEVHWDVERMLSDEDSDVDAVSEQSPRQ